MMYRVFLAFILICAFSKTDAREDRNRNSCADENDHAIIYPCVPSRERNRIADANRATDYYIRGIEFYFMEL